MCGIQKNYLEGYWFNIKKRKQSQSSPILKSIQWSANQHHSGWKVTKQQIQNIGCIFLPILISASHQNVLIEIATCQ